MKIEFRDGKYHGYVGGKLIVSASTKYYVKKKCQEASSFSSFAGERDMFSIEKPRVEFPINQRFQFVEQLVSMVASKQTPSCIITGEGGLGKSHTVIQALNANGLKDISEFDVGETVQSMKAYRVVKGFSTAKGLFRILFENKNNIIVFDDCDSILKDPDALNLLKGALDSYDKRLITWNTSIDNDNLPRFFQFTGGIIFISNLSQDKINQALKSRSMNVDLSMTAEQKIDRMKFIVKQDSFLPSIDQASKEDALSIISEMKDDCKELSLRTLITVCKIRNSNTNWKDLAKYMLTN